MPPFNYCSNSRLSLLAMVDCWAHLGINPYVHLDLAATPILGEMWEEAKGAGFPCKADSDTHGTYHS